MLIAEDLQCLKTIALMGGCRGPVFVSAQSLGSSLGISAQTAYRRLRSLEQHLCITRSMRPDGQYVTVISQGNDELQREYAQYRRIFEGGEERYSLAGRVITGLGEGRYYMSLTPYRTQFLQRLGFEPYPGTLNLRLDPENVGIRRDLERFHWVPISGFTAEGRTFGDVRCIPCQVGGIAGGIVVPGRTHYPEDIVEIVSPVGLREALHVGDGDPVTVEVQP
jgi:riboflavin kinase